MSKKKPSHSRIPDVGEGKRGVEGHIGYLLRQAHGSHKIRMEKALTEYDITLPQFSVLTMLDAYPGASGADLARLSLLTPQTMSVIVKNLDKAGLVTRRPHQEHGRIQVIDITDSGKTLLSKCKIAVALAEADLLKGFTKDEEAIIRHWLVTTAKNI